MLPQLSLLIHDSAERVRSAFVDLLCEIKNIKTIRFFDVVPVEHLLARLELGKFSPISLISSCFSSVLISIPVFPIDPESVGKKLTKLLLNSYFPIDQKGSVLVWCSHFSPLLNNVYHLMA